MALDLVPAMRSTPKFAFQNAAPAYYNKKFICLGSKGRHHPVLLYGSIAAKHIQAFYCFSAKNYKL